ncbi:hypothetical protein ACLG6S_13975 [Thermodesulfobacteriota bacterium B35]
MEDKPRDVRHLISFADKLKNQEKPFLDVVPCKIDIAWVPTLSEFESLELHKYDIILADIFIPYQKNNGTDNYLEHILNHVERWSQENNAGRLLPVIAYSGRDSQGKVIGSSNRDRLYDIWDKNANSPEYVVWRLFKLAQELYKNRPDTYLQRLIREIEPCWDIAWHDSVQEMAIEYHSGLTEADQIIKAGVKIKDIAEKIDLDFWRQSKKFWDVMERWEPLSRAITPNVRGHARHVINVFWIGYYILQHKSMRPVVEKWMDKIYARNNTVRSGNNDDAGELLKIWFVASIFHDIAGCVEKSRKIYDFQATQVLDLFSDFFSSIPSAEDIELNDEILKEQMIEFCTRYDDSLQQTIKEYFKNLLKAEYNIDHGLSAALLLVNLGKNKEYFSILNEAARAIALHNIIGNNRIDLTGKISWGKEPIACLLVLCDQLQTWDRERGDGGIKKFNNIESAELVDLSVESSSEKVTVNLRVNYIAPYHVQHAGVGLQNEVKDNLKNILRDYPYSALERLKKPWPFQLVFTPYMDMREINLQHTFGT